MKIIPHFILSLFLGVSVSAQMTTYVPSQTFEGTSLGANETLSASGIDIANAVKMRGYVDFIFSYDDQDGGAQNESYSTASDVDFLLDLSPVTAELHLDLDGDTLLEQAFGRYSFNDAFNVTFGRQLTVLGFEDDEAPGLYAVSNAYLASNDDVNPVGATVRRNYKDGTRLNFNNGQFGLSFGLHDGYWANDDFNGDNIAIDLAGSVMIIPGLEAQIGYAHEEVGDDDISQFNTWVSFSPNDLTLALEYDNYDVDVLDVDYWALMLMANYQFADWFAATLRYSHEDVDDAEADRLTFAFLFTITDNLYFNVEYSTTNGDDTIPDYDEFYLESLLTF